MIDAEAVVLIGELWQQVFSGGDKGDVGVWDKGDVGVLVEFLSPGVSNYV